MVIVKCASFNFASMISLMYKLLIYSPIRPFICLFIHFFHSFIYKYRDPSSITPSDSGHGYKQVKAKIGRSKVRPWQLEAFKNPSRNDDLVLHHWRRKADEGKVYPFSKFSKVFIINLYHIFSNCHLKLSLER